MCKSLEKKICNDPTVPLADVSQSATVDYIPVNDEGLNRDKNLEDMLHMVHDSNSQVAGSCGHMGSIATGNSTQMSDKNMISQLPNENTIADLFGVLLPSIEDIEVLTRNIEAGDYEHVMTKMTSVERKAIIEAIEVVWKKILADVMGTYNVSKGMSTDFPINKDISLKIDTPIVKSVSFTKPISYVGATRASSSKPSTGKANFRHLEYDNVFKGVQLSILINVLKTVSSRFENTLSDYFIAKWIAFPVVECYPIILDSFTSSMCIESWGRSSFARCLIKVKADEALKDNITMGIPLPEDMGFTKETVSVEYEWRPPRCKQCKTFGHVSDECPKNTMTIPNVVMNNDGFQTVVNKRKSGKTGAIVVKTTWQPIKPKVRFDPKAHGNSQTTNDGPNSVHSSSKEKPIKAANITSSFYTRGSPMKGDVQYPTSASNIPTSNPYDALDDKESDEEVEFVFDETINLLESNIMKAKNTTLDTSKT
ncbi:hypothetical protein Tco_0657953 [Tanacetum coccineum]